MGLIKLDFSIVSNEDPQTFDVISPKDLPEFKRFKFDVNPISLYLYLSLPLIQKTFLVTVYSVIIDAYTSDNKKVRTRYIVKGFNVSEFIERFKSARKIVIKELVKGNTNNNRIPDDIA